MDISWENPKENFKTIEKGVNDIDIDLLILPEMFSTGFSMNSEIAESPDGESVSFMKKMAIKGKFAICGSLPIKENGNYYNRLVWIFPDGKIQYYNKRHLFSYAYEDKHYTPGDHKIVVEYKGWKICPLICYDLRFPVWSRNIENYDLLLYVANWPVSRDMAWKTLLKARSIENVAYVAGVNRFGKDASNQDHNGFSMIYDGTGNKCNYIEMNPNLRLFSINKKNLEDVRSKFPFLQDKDNFHIDF